MNLCRIWETITGRPHERRDSGTVRSATVRLLAAAEDFRESIKPYEEAEDPVAMLFDDIAKQRRVARGSGGNESKLDS